MDKTIIVKTNLFAYNQYISILNENGKIETITDININNIPEAVIQACLNYNTNNVFLCGGPNIILHNYKDDILNYCNTEEGKTKYGYLPKLNITLEGE